MNEIDEIEPYRNAARDYLKARKKFLDIANEIKEADVEKKKNWLWGNDNIIGRIGEFIVYQYLTDLGVIIEERKNQSQKGWDFKCFRADMTEFYVSVKTITSENKIGNTSHITYPNNIEKGEELIPWNELIVVILNKELKIEKIGHITREIFKDRNKSKNPTANKSWFNEKGLFKEYVIKGDKLNNYL